MHDLYHNIAVQQALNPVTATSNQTSAAIDLRGFNSATVVFAVGQSGDTLSGSLCWTLKLQDSDDNSSYSDVTTAGLVNSAASYVIDDAAKDETAYSFGYIGGKRYLKAVATKTGTHTNGTPIGVLALKGHASLKPVT